MGDALTWRIGGLRTEKDSVEPWPVRLRAVSSLRRTPSRESNKREAVKKKLMSEFHAALCGAFYLLFFIWSCWTYPLGVSTFHLSSNKTVFNYDFWRFLFNGSKLKDGTISCCLWPIIIYVAKLGLEDTDKGKLTIMFTHFLGLHPLSHANRPNFNISVT